MFPLQLWRQQSLICDQSNHCVMTSHKHFGFDITETHTHTHFLLTCQDVPTHRVCVCVCVSECVSEWVLISRVQISVWTWQICCVESDCLGEFVQDAATWTLQMFRLNWDFHKSVKSSVIQKQPRDITCVSFFTEIFGVRKATGGRDSRETFECSSSSGSGTGNSYMQLLLQQQEVIGFLSCEDWSKLWLCHVTYWPVKGCCCKELWATRISCCTECCPAWSLETDAERPFY